MLGLTTLYREMRPHSTLEKIHFLISHAWQNAHAETVVISFVSLLTLVLVRASKNIFKKWWWIYRLPEVLLVVVVSTRTSSHSSRSALVTYA